jgi:hypothetical protein
MESPEIFYQNFLHNSDHQSQFFSNISNLRECYNLKFYLVEYNDVQLKVNSFQLQGRRLREARSKHEADRNKSRNTYIFNGLHGFEFQKIQLFITTVLRTKYLY